MNRLLFTLVLPVASQAGFSQMGNPFFWNVSAKKIKAIVYEVSSSAAVRKEGQLLSPTTANGSLEFAGIVSIQSPLLTLDRPGRNPAFCNS